MRRHVEVLSSVSRACVFVSQPLWSSPLVVICPRVDDSRSVRIPWTNRRDLSIS